MDVGSISSAYGSMPQAVQRSPEAAEVRQAGGDRDGDSDDAGASTVQAPPKPTVNLTGQRIGQLINVSA